MTPSPSVKSCHSHLHALLPLERDRQLDARRRIEISADLLRRLVRLMRAQSGVGKRSVAEFAEVKVCVGHLWSVLIEPGAGGDAGLKIDVQGACVERAEARARVERAEGVNVEVHVEFYLRRDHVELRIQYVELRAQRGVYLDARRDAELERQKEEEAEEEDDYGEEQTEDEHRNDCDERNRDETDLRQPDATARRAAANL